MNIIHKANVLTNGVDCVVSTVCPMCGKSHGIWMKLADWREGCRRVDAGAFMQDAFPKLTNSQRELLMTGTDSECWDRLFGREEDA